MSSYFKFNKWVCDYYINNCIPYQLNSLSIPSSEIDEFAFENDIKLDDFKEINKGNWYYLLKEKEGTPQYFGLIALQCLAAFKMQNQNGLTAANFKVRFANLIGITNSNELNSFFSEDYDNEFKVQEKIWFNAQAFLNSKKIKINLPEIARYAGRFIQFPKSQIVINYEDLKEYKDFFISINNEFESISFEYFKKYYLNNISHFRNNFLRDNNTRNENQLSEVERKIKLKQIFDFYCSEEWMNSNERKKLNDRISNKDYIIKFSPYGLLLYDGDHKELDDLNSIIRKNKFLVFKENHDYPNEYESVNSISFNDNNILLIYNSPANSNEIAILGRVFSSIPYENPKHNILIFKILNTDNSPDFLRNKIISDNPIELKGFKVSGKKKYFVNHPPIIYLNKDISCHIYFDKKRISKNEIDKVGKYTIKINGYSNYNFEIIDIPVLDYLSNDMKKSLVFDSLNYLNEEIGSINGLHINFKNKVNLETLNINNWIKTINGSKTNSDSKLLKSISQNINGKY